MLVQRTKQADGFRDWLEPDQPDRSSDVRSGSGWQRVKTALLTHNGHSRDPSGDLGSRLLAFGNSDASGASW